MRGEQQIIEIPGNISSEGGGDVTEFKEECITQSNRAGCSGLLGSMPDDASIVMALDWDKAYKEISENLADAPVVRKLFADLELEPQNSFMEVGVACRMSEALDLTGLVVKKERCPLEGPCGTGYECVADFCERICPDIAEDANPLCKDFAIVVSGVSDPILAEFSDIESESMGISYLRAGDSLIFGTADYVADVVGKMGNPTGECPDKLANLMMRFPDTTFETYGAAPGWMNLFMDILFTGEFASAKSEIGFTAGKFEELGKFTTSSKWFLTDDKYLYSRVSKRDMSRDNIDGILAAFVSEDAAKSMADEIGTVGELFGAISARLEIEAECSYPLPDRPPTPIRPPDQRPPVRPPAQPPDQGP